MFDAKTVFILGAGASWHYGYPTGENLVKDIIEKAKTAIDILKEGFDSQSFDSRWIQLEYFKQENYRGLGDGAKIRKILEECSEFIKRAQQVNPPVIDYFLGQNRDLQNIGKLMIAWVILEHESKYEEREKHGGNWNLNHLRRMKNSPYVHEQADAHPGKIQINNYKDDWYRFLLYKLIMRCKKSEDLLINEVNFITFNYDVSLEQTLSQCLNTIEIFQNEKSKITEFLGKDRFLHVYGKIRENPFQEKPKINWGRPGEKHQRVNWLREIIDTAYLSSKGIRTIDPDDKTDDEATITRAKSLIRHAKYIYILGYGFDKNNSDRLGLNESLTHPKSPIHVFFTNFGDKQAINKRVSQLFFGNSGRFHPADPHVIPNSPNPLVASIYEKSTHNVYDAIESDFDFL